MDTPRKTKSNQSENINEEEMNTISPAERATLDDSIVNLETPDNQQLKKASLDNTDNDGELLNENSFGQDFTGEDLDVPGAEQDDSDEIIGEEDEENNSYSQADTD
jgi:hypothetical protein